jgi:2-hydroxy-3-keto-5-methylthiopentenyl-1-phosphate phosphatase
MANIAIVWDFDGTLTPQDTTTKVVELLETGEVRMERHALSTG